MNEQGLSNKQANDQNIEPPVSQWANDLVEGSGPARPASSNKLNQFIQCLFSSRLRRLSFDNYSFAIIMIMIRASFINQTWLFSAIRNDNRAEREREEKTKKKKKKQKKKL